MVKVVIEIKCSVKGCCNLYRGDGKMAYFHLDPRSQCPGDSRAEGPWYLCEECWEKYEICEECDHARDMHDAHRLCYQSDIEDEEEETIQHD